MVTKQINKREEMASSSHDFSSEQLIVLKGTGEYDKFKELLRSRLHECGWVDQIHMLCRQTAKNSHMNVNDLFNEVGKKGRSLVPASVKQELLLRVKESILQKAGYYDDPPS